MAAGASGAICGQRRTLIREIQAAGYTSYNAIARATRRSEGRHRQWWPVETCAGAADFRPGNRAHSWTTLAAAPARLAAQAPGSLWPQWMVCNDTISYVWTALSITRDRMSFDYAVVCPTGQRSRPRRGLFVQQLAQFCSAHFRGVYTIWHRDGLPAASQLRRYANLKQQGP